MIVPITQFITFPNTNNIDASITYILLLMPCQQYSIKRKQNETQDKNFNYENQFVITQLLFLYSEFLFEF